MDHNSDTIKVISVNKSFANTKRGLLSLVSSIFDPLGIVTPSLIEPKLIIQELWRQQIDWDELLPLELHSRWMAWKTSISSLSDVTINRWYGFDQSCSPELHIFADASEKAYGAVSYIKSTTASSVNVSFVLAKSRLAPLKGNLTIPKLELQAAVVATRLKNSILERLEVHQNNIYFWSDSMTTLKYIKNENRRFPPFVMHRVNEIRLNSSKESWKFVPGDYNPADHCTRYTRLDEIKELPNWLKSPPFLCQKKSNYDVIFPDTFTEEDETDDSQLNVNVSKSISTDNS